MGVLLFESLRLYRQCVYAVAELRAEHVVDQPVLGDTAEPAEPGSEDDGVEVAPVTGHLGAGTGNSCLYPLLELLRSDRHSPSVATPLA